MEYNDRLKSTDELITADSLANKRQPDIENDAN